MHCPFCQEQDTKVVDSRYTANNVQVRRRRECVSCNERFTTYEMIEITLPRVIKSNNIREAFSEEKLKKGMLRALEKRPVSIEDVEISVVSIINKIKKLGEKEISSRKIGELVMHELYQLDEVAYVRFASVYRKFESIGEFKDEIQRIENLESV